MKKNCHKGEMVKVFKFPLGVGIGLGIDSPQRGKIVTAYCRFIKSGSDTDPDNEAELGVVQEFPFSTSSITICASS